MSDNNVRLPSVSSRVDGYGGTLHRLKKRGANMVRKNYNAAANVASNVTSPSFTESGTNVEYPSHNRFFSVSSNRYYNYILTMLMLRSSSSATSSSKKKEDMKTAGPKIDPSTLHYTPKLSYNDFNDSNSSLYSDSNTLVYSSGSASSIVGSTALSSTLTFHDDEQPSFSTNKGINISQNFTHIESQPVIERDIKTFIKNFNHSVAYQLGESTHLHYYQLPFPWRENRYIIHGYRFYNSHKKSLLSIFNWYGWHNETSNIWTHLLGGLYLLYLGVYDFPNSDVWNSDTVPKPAKVIVYIFLFAAVKCMFASVFWHTFNGTSFLGLRSKFACVDYSGITLLITASILTSEFVTMYDYKWSLISYLSISTFLGVFGIFMNWSPKFDRPEARPLRIKFFILLATMGFLSFIQLIFLRSWEYASWLMTPVTNKSIIWYLVGVFFYGSFIPERFRTDVLVDECIPTEQELSTDLNIVTKHKHIHFRATPTKHPKFMSCQCHSTSFKSLWWVDYFGSSHTFWHFFVVLGVVGHYNAIMEMISKRWISS